MVVTKKCTGNKLVIKVEIDLAPKDPVLAIEERIQDACNAVGLLATEQLLKQYDFTGQPITVNGVPHCSKGLSGKEYHTPYGQLHLVSPYVSASSGRENILSRGPGCLHCCWCYPAACQATV